MEPGAARRRRRPTHKRRRTRPAAVPPCGSGSESRGSKRWHVQLNQGGLKLVSGRPYTLRFQARAEAPGAIVVNAQQAHDPWQILWSGNAELTSDWKTFEFIFTPTQNDDNARITFSNMGLRPETYEFAGVSLRSGGVLGLREGEELGALGFFRKRDFARRTPEAQRDWIRFLWEVESDYWTGMARFLKQDLGVQSLIVGTQMGWSPFPIQAQLDVIDSHAYWQHPHFPGRSWDMNNWFVQNVPMAGAPDGGTLPGLALSRVAGKPFICTEYNHSAPNTYSSEAFLLLSAFAAMQDWDGIFAFAYSHRHDEWDTGYFPSFFDIDQHPEKMATLPAAAAMFVRGDVPSPPNPITARPGREAVVEAIRRAGPWGLGAGRFGVPREAALRTPVAVAVPSESATEPPQTPRPRPQRELRLARRSRRPRLRDGEHAALEGGRRRDPGRAIYPRRCDHRSPAEPARLGGDLLDGDRRERHPIARTYSHHGDRLHREHRHGLEERRENDRRARLGPSPVARRGHPGDHHPAGPRRPGPGLVAGRARTPQRAP